jgi:biopolymer transport protein ExbD
MSVTPSESGGQDFDLNLAPIIDMFTVLITYLLVSASFITLGAYDVGIATSAPSSAKQVSPAEVPVQVTVDLDARQKMTIRVTGGPSNVNIVYPLPAVRGDWNLGAAAEKLAELKRRYPGFKDATMSAAPAVVYKDIVEVIEKLRKVVPKIYLGA